MDPSSNNCGDASLIGLRNFPTELIKDVLSKLLGEMDPECFTKETIALRKTEFGCLITLRLVCCIWRTLIDDILEERIISFLRGWIPNRRLKHLFPKSYAQLHVNNSTIVDGDVGLVYPPILVDSNGKNPFPGRGFIMKEVLPLCSKKEMKAVLNRLIIPYTHHLSLLCLSGMKLRVEEFRRILEGAKNLKGLVVNRFNIFYEGDTKSLVKQLQLPPLQKLNTLLVLENDRYSESGIYTYVGDEDGGEPRRETRTDLWLFDSYAAQIDKLELVCAMRITTVDFPNLKQLSILTKGLSFLHQIGAANALEKLSISRYYGSKTENLEFGRVEDLFRFTDRYAGTLVELYFDISWSKLDEKEALVDKQHNYLHQSTLPKRTIYPNLRKFTTKYPESTNEIPMLSEYMLSSFPTLQHLILLEYQKHWYPEPIFFPHVNPERPNVPFVNELWARCKSLQKIYVKTLVYNDVDPTDLQATFFRPSGL